MKFSEHVYFRRVYFSLPLQEVSSPRSVFISLIKGSKKNILVDSGVSYNYPDLVALCAEAGLTLDDIDIMLVTHYHPDHIGGLPRLSQEYPHMQIYAHAHCKEMAENIDKHFSHRPMAGFHYLIPGNAIVSHVLSDNEVIDAGDVQIQVIFTPGHSKDSVSFYIPEESLLLAGDALPDIHGMPIYDDLDQLFASFDRMEKIGASHVLSSFSGLWDPEAGNCYTQTRAYVQKVQRAVDEFEKSSPSGTLEELGAYVLKQLNVSGKPMGVFLNTVKLHLGKMHH